VTTGGLTLANTVSDPSAATWINAACVSSLQQIATYGYYAARVKASDISMVSAFWFQGNYSEIDVEENVGASTIASISNRLVPNTHYFPNGWATDTVTPFFYTMPTGAADGYATYSVWWKDENNIQFFYNGVLVASVTLHYNFSEPMYLFFSTGAESDFGIPAAASLNDPTKNKMYVQWVRSWTLSPQ
jgi:beta-glucanase (GH16 family)